MKANRNQMQRTKEKLTSNYNNIKIMIDVSLLMATYANEPGTVKQVAEFTESLQTSYEYVIIIAAFLNIGAQVNIWRIISVSKMREQDIANAVLPGLGYLITF